MLYLLNETSRTTEDVILLCLSQFNRDETPSKKTQNLGIFRVSFSR